MMVALYKDIIYVDPAGGDPERAEIQDGCQDCHRFTH